MVHSGQAGSEGCSLTCTSLVSGVHQSWGRFQRRPLFVFVLSSLECRNLLSQLGKIAGNCHEGVMFVTHPGCTLFLLII